MANKKLIIFATFMEAKATLELLDAKLKQGDHLYSYDAGHVLICGVGLVSATYMTSRYIPLATIVYNVGIAASLHDHISIGHFNQISNVAKFLSLQTQDDHSIEFAKKIFPSIKLSDSGSGRDLISSDYPIHDEVIRKTLNQDHHLVDMEGYGIAYACKKAGVHCEMWKLVSDFGMPGDQEMIMKRKQVLTDTLAQKVISF